MTLADYLESKAEYIFDNYPIEFYEGVKPEDLNKNRYIIINRLKKGLRKLANIHHSFHVPSESGLRQSLFGGLVRVYFEKSPDILQFHLNINFPVWPVSKIIIEKTNRKFEEVFTVWMSASVEDPRFINWDENNGEFEVNGHFLPLYDKLTPVNYLPANLLFIHPLIRKLYKYNGFNIFNNAHIKKLSLYYYDNIFTPYHREYLGHFGDFIALNNSEKDLGNGDNTAKYLLVAKIPNGSVSAIKLEEEEYYDIFEIIDHTKKTKKVQNSDIFLKDVLLKYAYWKIKGGIP